MIQLFKPWIKEEDIQAVEEVLRSGWLGLGPKTQEFEQALARYTGSPHAVGLNSATAALHLAARLMKEHKKPAGTVLVPSVTFISSAMVCNYEGFEVVFVDVEEDTLNFDFEDAEKKISKDTAFFMPVHYGGNPVNMKRLHEFSKEHALPFVEDASHAMGSFYKNQHLGTFGDAGVFSFQAIKNLACGDGGMLVTQHKDWAAQAKRLRWMGIDKDTFKRSGTQGYEWYYEVNELGYKYHMFDIQAALGLSQLARLDKANEKRRALADIYRQELEGVDWVHTLKEHPDTVSAQHNFVVRVEKNREKLCAHLKKQGIQTGVHYTPLHLQPFYAKKGRQSCPVAERVGEQILTLPLHPGLGEEDLGSVVQGLKSFKQ